MTLQTWLAVELRAAGITVIETPGWQTRQTRPGFEPQGIVNHDTVTGPTLTRIQEQAILINGRPDLPGPLSQLGLHRDGVVSVIAAGRCNHNGGSSTDQWPDPIWSNDCYGLEVFCYGGLPGHIEPWNPVQQSVAAKVNAVICNHHSWSETRCQGHKETDPHRKIDPFLISCPALRANVYDILHPPPPPIPLPVPVLIKEQPVILLNVPDIGNGTGGQFLASIDDGGKVCESIHDEASSKEYGRVLPVVTVTAAEFATYTLRS